MDANAPLKKSSSMKEWMAQADPPKEASTVKKINCRLLLLFSSIMTHYFKEWMTPSGALKKKFIIFTKI